MPGNYIFGQRLRRLSRRWRNCKQCIVCNRGQYIKCPEFWDKEYNQKYARLWQTMTPEMPVEKAILGKAIMQTEKLFFNRIRQSKEMQLSERGEYKP